MKISPHSHLNVSIGVEFDPTRPKRVKTHLSFEKRKKKLKWSGVGFEDTLCIAEKMPTTTSWYEEVSATLNVREICLFR